MPPKLSIHNQRMMQLMRYCIQTGDCETQKDFLESIGISPTNLNRIRSGDGSFTVDQMITACKKYKVSMDWIAGFRNDMKRSPGKKAIDLLREAVVAVDQELRQK